MSKMRNLFVVSLLLGSVWPIAAASAKTLGKAEIARQIIGKPLHAKRMGLSVRIFYKPDGTVRMKFPLMSGAGTWVYHGDGICMTLTSGPKRGKTCVTFEHLGGNKYRNSEGIAFEVKPKD